MNYIREVRKAKGLTMLQLGNIVGCSEGAISHYETGKRDPGYEGWLKLAEALDTTIDYLMRGVDESIIEQKEKPDANSDGLRAMTLGQVIKQYREQQNISIRAFAKECVLSPAYISALEKDRNTHGGIPVPSVATYKSIAKAMHIEIDDLVRMVDDDISLSDVPIVSYNKQQLIDEINDMSEEEVKMWLKMINGYKSN